MMAELVYALCALTSLACAGLLLRSFAADGGRLLLWSGLCFVGLGVNDALLFLFAVSGEQPLVPRALAGLLGVSFLLYGLVFDSE
jgi:hypothetical protein